MAKGVTQARLLETGERIFLEKGYNHTGIQAVLKDAGVPKGSFYHYFKSKEDFGLKVVEASNNAYLAKLEQFFGDETRSPLARLRHYFESGVQTLAGNDFRCGCLVGNLSQEMASQNDAFRQRLDEILLGWRDRFAQCLEEAQESGELCGSWDVKMLASFCIDSWEGAILRAKVTKSTEPLETFVKVLFNTVLAAKAPETEC